MVCREGKNVKEEFAKAASSLNLGIRTFKTFDDFAVIPIIMLFNKCRYCWV